MASNTWDDAPRERLFQRTDLASPIVRADGERRRTVKTDNRAGVGDNRPSAYRAMPPAVGEAVEIVDINGEKHPELAGKTGRITLIRRSDGMPVIEVDGMTFKAVDLYWRRT